ncbi:MAG: hypothetical protein Barrevirus11_10 [Barrevirus sp.]|uniref:Uncharacterized protein n=1 Tax=Barrevirus sp. TaxID=2487763 RepID=A0A3G4ZQA2_9VIRU|nr:MAG: hypothetical protein Barrevirus11_10 [Barrevirus sp.]
MDFETYKKSIGSENYKKLRDSTQIQSLYHHRLNPSFRLTIWGHLPKIWNRERILVAIIRVEKYNS